MHEPNPLNLAFKILSSNLKDLREGLEPDVIAYWYRRVEDRAIEIVPAHLRNKIHFEQDRILWMKFRVDISKRAVPYIMQVLEEYIPIMPYSTGLYFSKVQQILIEQLNKELC